MTVPEIIAALTPCTGHFPKDAVEAAIAQREEAQKVLPRKMKRCVAAVYDRRIPRPHPFQILHPKFSS